MVRAVVRAAQEQAAYLIHVSTTVVNARVLQLAERLAPPLIITAAEIDLFLQTFRGAVESLAGVADMRL